VTKRGGGEVANQISRKKKTKKRGMGEKEDYNTKGEKGFKKTSTNESPSLKRNDFF